MPTKAVRLRILALAVLLSVGCASTRLLQHAADERRSTMTQNSADPCGTREHWALIGPEHAGTILTIELSQEHHPLSEVVSVRHGHVELQRSGRLLLRFDVDRVSIEHAMGTRYATYRNSFTGQELTVASAIEHGEPYQLEVAAGSFRLLAGLAAAPRR